jgi:hypothetical protein
MNELYLCNGFIFETLEEAVAYANFYGALFNIVLSIEYAYS